MTNQPLLHKTLRDAGINISHEYSSPAYESPWFIKFLIGFSAWVASWFLIGFVVLSLKPSINSTETFMAVGAVLLTVSSIILYRPRNEFVDNLALAFSLAGQIFLAFALQTMLSWQNPEFWWALTLMQLTLCAIPNFIHRVTVSAFAGITLAIALAHSGAAYIATVLVLAMGAFTWSYELKHKHWMRFYQAVGFGTAAALLLIQYGLRFNAGTIFYAIPTQQWATPAMGELLTVFIATAVLWHITRRVQLSGNQWAFALGVLALLGVASGFAYGLLQATVLLVLGFYGGNRVLMGLATLALIAAISSYYYLLDTTLLIKSATLLAIGAVLLLTRVAYRRLWPEENP
ncbi:DUF4401 domain-containing protein [Gilvimarinus agarilyticus]|uniref:DUF4401 domain-containing protein n=1 Tax=Gilvimarinus sp. 2_MG-2023 TaxID=3062666 RepID=UPI001C086EED|nr:DUF4401 domain-containing protein [Gilvimarinus sp. 2_MG-2023]MBU2887824.1 DUF4401 domain-containing protein [Gilvimarinus agarilyticus]MDO6572462.1 DUF4401 domain-containing protein [Gilvimarinus sp. 2_MG-2023]